MLYFFDVTIKNENAAQKPLVLLKRCVGKN